MEKIKQDFFSWLPKAKREIKYTTNYQQPQPPVYPAAPAFDPAPSTFYPEQSLPQKQQHVRQATFSQAAPSTPSFLSGDGGQLFKIIQVQTESGAPLYQIVPTTSSAGQQQPVLPAHNTATTTYNTSPPSHTHPQCLNNSISNSNPNNSSQHNRHRHPQSLTNHKSPIPCRRLSSPRPTLAPARLPRSPTFSAK